VTAPGTQAVVALESNFLPQYNAEFENHLRLYRADEFRWSNHLAIPRTNYLVVTSLDEVMSHTIVAVTVDNVGEILKCWHLQSECADQIEPTSHEEQNIVGTGMFRPRWSTSSTVFIRM
jgi:hypothetical protein